MAVKRISYGNNNPDEFSTLIELLDSKISFNAKGTNMSLPDISKSYSLNIFSRIIESYKINKFIGKNIR